MLTSVLIGSEPNLDQQDFTCTVDGNADALSLPAGPYYLEHDEYVIALCGSMASILSGHTEAPTVAVFITQGGLVRIEVTDAASFSITWGTATDLRDLLGFTGNLSGALSYTATNPSPLIWIPRKTEVSEARLGTLGDPAYDTAVSQPASGAPSAWQHNVRYENQFTWRHVLNSTESSIELVRSKTGDQGGKWWSFHERVVRRFSRFLLHRERAFVAGSTDPMGFAFAIPTQLGPYVWRAPSGAIRYSAPREEDMRESYARITLPVVLVDEYPS